MDNFNEGTIHMQKQETNLHFLHIIMMKCLNLHYSDNLHYYHKGKIQNKRAIFCVCG